VNPRLTELAHEIVGSVLRPATSPSMPPLFVVETPQNS
jgi:hypothetical protein